MTDREFWLAVRGALIQIIRAIERKYLANCRYEEDTIHPGS